MANILSFFSGRKPAQPAATGGVAALLEDFSIEVMPRTAEKIEDFRPLLPEGSRVYIAHIDGTPIEEMVRTAKRLAAEGFPVMPHFPARIIRDKATLADWIARYQGEAGVDQALLLAGGVSSPSGEFSDSMALMRTGLFEKAGFRRIHVAGHPEGNRDIDPAGDAANAMAALRWKQDWARGAGVEMAIATQFCFEAEPVIEWAERLREEGIALPVHIGVAGPAKLQTLVKFAMTCGVGPSVRVLQRRAADVTKLMLPFTPEAFLADLAAHRAANPDFAVRRVHFFPLGGIRATADFTGAMRGARKMAATA